MANANTKLMPIQIRPTNTANSTSPRTQVARSNRANSNSRNYRSNTSARNEKNNFGAELDKANAQVNQAQQQSGEVQAAAETAESAPVDEIVKKSSNGNKNNQQDAPRQNISSQTSEKTAQPVTENLNEENIAVNVADVTKIISPTIQPQAEVPADVPQNIPSDIPKSIPQNLLQNVEKNIPQNVPQNLNVDAEVIKENISARVTSTIPTAEIPLDVDKNISTQFENPMSQIKVDVSTENLVNLDESVQDKIPDVAENLPTLATSADMAFYFTASTENLLANNTPAVEVDSSNLMSIMPQSNDDKAQSMLNFLSGRTWQSVKSNEDVPVQNLNLQNLEPQSVLPAQNQSQNLFPIQPNFQPRPLNIQQAPVQTVQADLQSNLQIPVQTVQAELQPTLQAPIQTVQADLQPNLNQATVQNFVQNWQAPVQTVQADFQPTLNQAPVQNFVQSNLQAPVQNVQADLQPTLNQAPVQNFVQSTLNQVPVQNVQADLQPNLNQAPAQNFVQPTLNQTPLQATLQPMDGQSPLQATLQTDSQSLMNQNQAPLQNLAQNNLQPTLQAAPQIQQQQFGGEIQPQINSIQPHLEPKMVNRQTVNELFGVPLQVEEGQPSTPIMPLQSTPQQFEQNQQFTRNFQQNFSQLTADVETQSQNQTNTSGEENFVGNLAAVNNTTQNQPTAQVQAPEVMQAPREDFNVPTQIVEQARMIRNATNTEMVINLKPEHLGQLTLRVSVSTNGAITASFYSDNAQVRAIIENSIVQLKQELNDQGIKVDNVEVYAGLSEDGLLNGQGQQAWQQNQQRGRRGTINLDAVEEEVDALNPVNESTSNDGVDYKV